VEDFRTVAVLGASPKKERYSNRAICELKAQGYDVVPVNPGQTVIEGLPVAANLAAIGRPIDTLTIYVNPTHIDPLVPEIVAARPGRVIMNPGAESPELARALRQAGIPALEACTLVLLRTGQF